MESILVKKYSLDVFKRFRMEESNFAKNLMVPGVKFFKVKDGVKVDTTFFQQVVGSLMYLTTTRPDLIFVVSLISRYAGQLTELYLQAAKRVLRYLKGTTNLGIFYKKGGSDELIAFTDSDYADDLEDRKSTSRYVFMLSSGALLWSSKKQPIKLCG
jgi:hypothetical protein